MMKDEAYAMSMIIAPISPLEGVYTISGKPATVPPPIHVAKMHNIYIYMYMYTHTYIYIFPLATWRELIHRVI